MVASSKEKMFKLPENHVLNFFYDNDSGCALTVRVKGTKYHIIVDPSRLKDRSKQGKQIWKTYTRLLGHVKAADQDGGQNGNTKAPLFVKDDEDDDGPDSDDTKDSGIDVTDDEQDEHDCTSTEALQRWMLKPLSGSFPSKEVKELSLQDWYHCPTKYCNLYVQNGKLQTEEEDSPASAYEKRLDNFIPAMNLPKYIANLDIPIYSAEDITVLATSDEPAPVHPTRVKLDGKDLFLKTVGSPPFQSMVKRELQVMKQIEKEGLHTEIRVPLLRGLVQFGSAPSGRAKGKQTIMGFLIDPISDPTPLTLMLDKDISKEKRIKWADESARMVDLLHQHGIVWGDAKGDNFMVDANDDLWIIDFGGSYTEGWIDPELKETEEGDKQGLRKLCNGLEDPERCTFDGDEEAETRAEEKEAETDGDERASKELVDQNDTTKARLRGSERSSDNPKKRKHNEQDENEPSSKQAKQEQTSTSEEKYCYCNGPDSGRMLACDGKTCKRQWFHFDCVGITEAPSTKKWYCEECQPAHTPRSLDSCYGSWDTPYDDE